MKRMWRWKSLLYLAPLMVFFCQKTNSPWGFCVGNNDGFQTNIPHGAPFNFAIGQQCPEDFPEPDGPILLPA
jgi:hypothetical protein